MAVITTLRQLPAAQLRVAEHGVPSNNVETLRQKSFVGDALIDAAVSATRAFAVADRRRDAALVEAVHTVLRVYARERDRWSDFCADIGAPRPRRGPQPRSIFHSVLRLWLGLTAGDSSGAASKLANVLDEAVAAGVPPVQMQISNWLRERGSATRIIDDTREHQRFRTTTATVRTGNDIVHTSPDLARRLVAHYRPTGSVMDPCAGQNKVFYTAFPPHCDRHWCEISENKDFLDWREPLCWTMGNPPWSSDAYRSISEHAFRLSTNVVFLCRLNNLIGTTARHDDFRRHGHGLKEIVVIPWSDAGFQFDISGPMRREGYTLVAAHWQRGYAGDTKWTYWTEDDVVDLERQKYPQFSHQLDPETYSVEWYSPSRIFEALGCEFDIDVCSPGQDIVPWIPAKRHLTSADDGLAVDWGNAFVWMNPVFGSQLSLWTAKFMAHRNGICLIPTRTYTRWWQGLIAHADLVLFIKGHVAFIDGSSTERKTKNTQSAFGSALVAIGPTGCEALRRAADAGLGVLR